MAEQIALLLNDVSLTPFIRLSSLIIPGYAVYSILIGYLNGLREYKKQAINASCYSIFKAVFILALVLIGYSVMGAIVGFIFAPIAGLLIGIYFTGRRRTGRHHNQGEITSISETKIRDFSHLDSNVISETNIKDPLTLNFSGISVKQIIDFAVPCRYT